MKITRDVALSVQLLNSMKERQGLVTVQEMANELGETTSHLLQITRKLKKHGLIERKNNGPGSGMKRVNNDPIPVSEIYKALGREVKTEEGKVGEILQKVEEVLKVVTC